MAAILSSARLARKRSRSGLGHRGPAEMRREVAQGRGGAVAREGGRKRDAVTGGALARVVAREPPGLEERPVAGLQREQLAQGAVGRGGGGGRPAELGGPPRP